MLGRSSKMLIIACKGRHNLMPYFYHSASPSLCSSDTRFLSILCTLYAHFCPQDLFTRCFLWQTLPPDVLILNYSLHSASHKIPRPQAIPEHSMLPVSTLAIITVILPGFIFLVALITKRNFLIFNLFRLTRL